jgi:hypothetical protein
VNLYWKERKVSGNAVDVLVRPSSPLRPRILRISDGKEILLDGIVKSGWMQINLDGCSDIGSLRASIGGHLAENIATFCVEPLSRYYLLNVPIPKGLVGRQAVRVSVDGQDLPPWEVDVVASNA